MTHVGHERRGTPGVRVTAALSVALATIAPGCKKDEGRSGGGPDEAEPSVECQRREIESVAPAARSSMFAAPLDAVPSADGATIYFTALTDSGPAILRGPASGGEPTLLASGDPLAAPFGLMLGSDGTRLYIADSGAEATSDDEPGRIFALSVQGGVPEDLLGGKGTRPRSLDVVNEGGADRIYFTGVDGDGQAAVFRMDADGSNRTAVLRGAPLADPSGVAVARDGSIYVADAAGGDSGGPSVLRIRAGGVTEIASGLRFGHPAGIALFKDDSTLLVSGLDPIEGSAVVFKIDLVSNEVAKINDGIRENHDSAGLHRAHGADIFAWSNAAGETGTETLTSGGTVYVLKGKPLSACP